MWCKIEGALAALETRTRSCSLISFGREPENASGRSEPDPEIPQQSRINLKSPKRQKAFRGAQSNRKGALDLATVAQKEFVKREEQEVPRLINSKKAADILGRSPATLKRWRYEGVGPAYVEIEGRVSYDVAVLVEYINENTRVPSVRAAMEEFS